MFKRLTNKFKREIKIYVLVLKDKRTPWLARIILGLAIAYLFSPIDIIPDFIPILGQLDDAILVPLFIIISKLLIPKYLIQEYREKLKSQL